MTKRKTYPSLADVRAAERAHEEAERTQPRAASITYDDAVQLRTGVTIGIPATAMLPQRGGSAMSDAKTAALRENGKLGGRPRTSPQPLT